MRKPFPPGDRLAQGEETEHQAEVKCKIISFILKEKVAKADEATRKHVSMKSGGTMFPGRCVLCSSPCSSAKGVGERRRKSKGCKGSIYRGRINTDLGDEKARERCLNSGSPREVGWQGESCPCF